MSKNLDDLKRLAFENACIRCQYYVDKQCWNRCECVWKNIEKALKALEIIKEKKVNYYSIKPYFEYYNYEKYVEDVDY